MTGRIMAICLDSEFPLKVNAVLGKTIIVSLDELKELSDEGYTHAEAARHFNVPDSTFRTFLNRNKLRHLFTKNKRNNFKRAKENHHMTTDGKEGDQ